MRNRTKLLFIFKYSDNEAVKLNRNQNDTDTLSLLDHGIHNVNVDQ